MTSQGHGTSTGLAGRWISRLTGGRVDGDALAGSDTAKAAGLAGAMIANNVVGLVCTIVFARELKDNQGGGYGSLAALVSYFLILSVFGQAMQVATAREAVLGHLGVGHQLLDTVRRWSRMLVGFTLVLAVISVLLREPIASAVGVPQVPWGAALGLPVAGLWLWLSVLRGVLQGAGDYKSVGISLVLEQVVRLIAGAILALGLQVTGAFAGSLVAYLALPLYCLYRVRRRVDVTAQAGAEAPAAPSEGHRLLVHLRRAWAPIAGLIIIAVLQNIDIIAAKHRFSSSLASSYGAVAVAAKVLIWVAMGAGFYLVPEVSRRRAAGEDPRPILFRALGIVAVCSIPVLLIYAFASHLLIKAAFGADHTRASGSLLVLGLAFAALACTYLAVQYLLALRQTWFLVVLALVAIAEPIALLNASRRPTGFAAVALAVQVAGLIVAYGFALRRDTTGDAGPPDGRASPDDADALPFPEPVS